MSNDKSALEGGLKFDQDKPRMDLIDPYAAEQLALVLTFGAKKYAAHNWRKGIAVTKIIAAILRHTFAVLRGEDKDPETGLCHGAHAMCECMFLIWTLQNKREMDDRFVDGSDESIGCRPFLLMSGSDFLIKLTSGGWDVVVRKFATRFPANADPRTVIAEAQAAGMRDVEVEWL